MTYYDIKTPYQLYDFMHENIKYGFLSSNDNKTYNRNELNNDELYEKILFSSYYLQSPEELLKNKYGLCYDQVEFERKWFKENGYKTLTYYTPYHNHTFLIYIDDTGYNLFERTIKEYNGIHNEKTLDDIIKYYKENQLHNSNIDDIDLYLYDSVKFGCNFDEFISNCKNGLKY